MTWKLLHEKMTEDRLGYLPAIFSTSDPRPAVDQINDRYAHGGGFKPIAGFKLIDAHLKLIEYPGDPAMKPLASLVLHEDETIYLYPHAFVGIGKTDKEGNLVEDADFIVTRMD